MAVQDFFRITLEPADPGFTKQLSAATDGQLFRALFDQPLSPAVQQVVIIHLLPTLSAADFERLVAHPKTVEAALTVLGGIPVSTPTGWQLAGYWTTGPVTVTRNPLPPPFRRSSDPPSFPNAFKLTGGYRVLGLETVAGRRNFVAALRSQRPLWDTFVERLTTAFSAPGVETTVTKDLRWMVYTLERMVEVPTEVGLTKNDRFWTQRVLPLNKTITEITESSLAAARLRQSMNDRPKEVAKLRARLDDRVKSRDPIYYLRWTSVADPAECDKRVRAITRGQLTPSQLNVWFDWSAAPSPEALPVVPTDYESVVLFFELILSPEVPRRLAISRIGKMAAWLLDRTVASQINPLWPHLAKTLFEGVTTHDGFELVGYRRRLLRGRVRWAEPHQHLDPEFPDVAARWAAVFERFSPVPPAESLLPLEGRLASTGLHYPEVLTRVANWYALAQVGDLNLFLRARSDLSALAQSIMFFSNSPPPDAPLKQFRIQHAGKQQLIQQLLKIPTSITRFRPPSSRTEIEKWLVGEPSGSAPFPPLKCTNWSLPLTVTLDGRGQNAVRIEELTVALRKALRSEWPQLAVFQPPPTDCLICGEPFGFKERAAQWKSRGADFPASYHPLSEACDDCRRRHFREQFKPSGRIVISQLVDLFTRQSRLPGYDRDPRVASYRFGHIDGQQSIPKEWQSFSPVDPSATLNELLIDALYPPRSRSLPRLPIPPQVPRALGRLRFDEGEMSALDALEVFGLGFTRVTEASQLIELFRAREQRAPPEMPRGICTRTRSSCWLFGALQVYPKQACGAAGEEEVEPPFVCELCRELDEVIREENEIPDPNTITRCPIEELLRPENEALRRAVETRINEQRAAEGQPPALHDKELEPLVGTHDDHGAWRLGDGCDVFDPSQSVGGRVACPRHKLAGLDGRLCLCRICLARWQIGGPGVELLDVFICDHSRQHLPKVVGKAMYFAQQCIKGSMPAMPKSASARRPGMIWAQQPPPKSWTFAPDRSKRFIPALHYLAERRRANTSARAGAGVPVGDTV